MPPHNFGNCGWWAVRPKVGKKYCLQPMDFTFKVQLTIPNVCMVKISVFK